MSPKKLTTTSLYLGIVSLLGLLLVVIIQPDITALIWWPVTGIGLSLGLILLAFVSGWVRTVNKRIAMSDAINLCYLGEEQKEQE